MSAGEPVVTITLSGFGQAGFGQQQPTTQPGRWLGYQPQSQFGQSFRQMQQMGYSPYRSSTPGRAFVTAEMLSWVTDPKIRKWLLSLFGRQGG